MLWIALVADSGFGKSPAINATRRPIDQLQAEAMKSYNDEIRQYEAKVNECKRSSKGKPPLRPVTPVTLD